MARKKKYSELIAEHVAAVVERRQIEHVLHFTRLENLPGILAHGIRSRSDLTESTFDVYASDADRLDQEDRAVSVSISCYYPLMFEAKRYRAGDNPWAILILHPSILWGHHCLFFRHGAAKNATKYENGKRYGGFALEKLFDDCSLELHPQKIGFRDECGLPPSWPTFSEAEVQVMNPIGPDYIMGAWVETAEWGELVLGAFNDAGREECDVIVEPFQPRICYKDYRWG